MRAAPRQSVAAPAPPPARRKLSYKLQRELAELPARLEALEIRKRNLSGETIEPGFYARPRTEVAARLAELSALEAEIEALFARWSELEAGGAG
jgi:ATP-binding cassette subfamily F protein uup